MSRARDAARFDRQAQRALRGLERALVVAWLIAVALPCAAEEDDPFADEVLSRDERPPVLVVEPGELEETLKLGEEAKLSLTVRNAGGGTLAWSVPGEVLARTKGWLGLSETSGKLAPGKEQKVAVTLAATGLEPGMLDDKLVLQAPGATGSPFEVAVLLDVQPPERDQDRSSGRAAGRDGRLRKEPHGRNIGVRLELLLPGGGSRGDYGTAPLFGVVWRPDRNGGRLGYEIGVSFGGSDADSGLETSSILAGGANALWRLGGNGSQAFYALGGLSLVSETADDKEAGSTSNFGSTLNLGAGATFAGRYDARLGYSILLGSDNVGGAVAASFGVMF